MKKAGRLAQDRPLVLCRLDKESAVQGALRAKAANYRPCSFWYSSQLLKRFCQMA